jgi:hypothetical protein
MEKTTKESRSLFSLWKWFAVLLAVLLIWWIPRHSSEEYATMLKILTGAVSASSASKEYEE